MFVRALNTPLILHTSSGDHSSRKLAKFSKKLTFLTRGRVRIRG